MPLSATVQSVAAFLFVCGLFFFALLLLRLTDWLRRGRAARLGDKELTGTLKGYDDFVNIVMEDVTE